MNISFNIQVKMLAFISDHTYPLKSCSWLLNLECSSIFWAHSSIFFEHISFWCWCLDPHLTIVVFNLGTSTLLITTFYLLIFYYKKKPKHVESTLKNPGKNLKPRRPAQPAGDDFANPSTCSISVRLTVQVAHDLSYPKNFMARRD